MHGKLFLVTIGIFASVMQNSDGTSIWCPALVDQSLFGVICRVSDLTNQLVNASDICIKDCYCVHGAPNGGQCVENDSNPLKADCICDYTTPNPPLSVDCTTNPTNAALAVECGPNAVGLPLTLPLGTILQFTGQQVCALECNCFHGTNGGGCTHVGVITVNNEDRCKCT